MDFNPSLACQVVVTTDLNKGTGTKKILPGSIWEHTVGVCSTVEVADQATLSTDPRFLTLLRSNLKTPIKKLIEAMPFRCNVNEVTRARQEYIKREVRDVYTYIKYLTHT